jgi:GNAT superfamily N-acetyltransferase
MEIAIRRAVLSDAAIACSLVCQSIKELCVADHKGDESTITAWLANKSESSFCRWITSAQHVALVAERRGEILGFGLLNRTGKLALLYVAPMARLEGISTSLLVALEEEAIALGLKQISLESSITAKRFYQARGYHSSGDPVAGFGVTDAYPMVKHIAP